jgi:AcrR family transcriptional regulator
MTDVASKPSPVGRPRKSDRTREALRLVALQQFRERGFENANVADIAALAGVTERTFFRYFPTKEAVFIGDGERRRSWFSRALAERPADEHIVDSVRAAVLSFSNDRQVIHEMAQLHESQLTQVRVSAAIRGMQAAMSAAIRDHLMAQSGQDNLAVAVSAEMLSGAVFAAFSVWTFRPGPRDIAELIAMAEAALEMTRAGL